MRDHSRDHGLDRDGATGSALRGLLVCQFFGAFNDNAWKMVVTFLLIGAATADVPAGTPAYEALSQRQTTLAFLVFTLPFILFSLPAGVLADRLSKRKVIVAMKALEVLLMGAAAALPWFFPGERSAWLAVLALMGLQSALFSPAKYGILPEILPHSRLSAGNGALEFWTFLAIVAGTASGGVLLGYSAGRVWLPGVALTALAVIGWAASLAIPRVPPARSEGGMRETVASAWRAMRQDRVLGLAVVGGAFYWLVASMLGQNVIVYAKAVLGLTDVWAGAPLTVFAVGVGAGSVLAGKLSGDKVEYGLLPLGAMGLGVFCLLFGLLQPALHLALAFMALLGLSSGFLVVPLNAILQWRAPADRRGAVIALHNVFVFIGVLCGSLAADALSTQGYSSRAIFTAASLLVLAGTAWALWLLPAAFLRLVLFVLAHTVYRVRVSGREHVPEKGGALLVPNHVSFVDGLLLIASLDRRVHFIVDAGWFHTRLLAPFMRALGAIPVTAGGSPKETLRALRDAGRHLDEGRLVCIFAEGQITRTGMLNPFRRGMARIAKGRAAPIIPVYLDRVWGSIFSFEGGRFLGKLPQSLPYPVTVCFGEPLPSSTPIQEVRRAVQELATEAWMLRQFERRPLHRSFIRVCRHGPGKLLFADASRPRVSRRRALAGAIALARALRPRWSGRKRVGLLLPPSVAGALANIAAALAGRTAVNLNYTAGPAGMGSAARQAGLDEVLTSRAFLEKAGLALPEGVAAVYLEDIAAGIGAGQRFLALVLAVAAPARWIERACGLEGHVGPGDPVTIIFSSGSTGAPKGVVLSHANIDANAEASVQVLRATEHDGLLGVLPLFHSFGYLSLWVAASRGVAAAFHPNPLDAAAVGALVQRYRLTLLLATPTFLQLYLRRCTPAQFGSLRFVLAGAEKLPERLALAFEDRFGIRPLEGYGATECSPVIAGNAPDFRAPGFYQPGAKRGSVGQALPGVSVRVVDSDLLQAEGPAAAIPRPLPPGEAGMLVVRGPNVMSGYLDQPELTGRVLWQGWYVTGDIARLDEDGFITITDRLARLALSPPTPPRAS